jgi:putative phage-type endonuclease
MTTTARPTEHRQNTPGWVDARRDSIGSSDLPILTGNSPYGTSIYSLWAFKTRLGEPDPVDPDTQELYDLGHALEDDIAERYTVNTGIPLRRMTRMIVRRDEPWASASLDRIDARRGQRRIVECKWVPYRSWRNDGPEPVPAYVQDQIQWQLYVSGYDAADVAVLLGAKVWHYEIEPDAAYQNNLLFIARWFRQLVETGTPPAIDGSEATRKALTWRYPTPMQDMLEPTPELDALAAQLAEAKLEAKVATTLQETLENQLRSEIGEHSGIAGETWNATWTRNKDGNKTDFEAIARGYRRVLEAIDPDPLLDTTLGAFPGIDQDKVASDALVPAGSRLGLADLLDAVEALHTRVVPGPRVLRFKSRDEETGKWI